jgi:hypothetical protein
MLDEKCSVSKWWMPLVWATSIIDTARKEDRIKFVLAINTQHYER